MCNKSKEKTKSSQTSQATMTGQESDLYNTGLASYNSNANGSAMSLINSILAGDSSQAGAWGNLIGGIDENTITQMSQKAVSDLLPSFQSSGILDSGVAASIAGRTAGDIRLNAAEYNQTNKLNLLNLALSGQTSLQNANTNQYSVLANQLAGLRKITQTGKSTTTSTPSALQTAMSVMGGVGSLMTGFGGLATGFGWGSSK